MNITVTKTVATGRTASTRKIIVLFAMSALLVTLFCFLNAALPFLLALVLTPVVATVLLYLTALVAVPELRPTSR